MGEKDFTIRVANIVLVLDYGFASAVIRESDRRFVVETAIMDSKEE